MISLEEARAQVLRSCPRPPATEVPLAGALGLVLAEDVVAGEDVPPFPNTAMDGYAVRSEDVAGASAAAPARLRVIGTLAAGAYPQHRVGPREALRIMTGAPFPQGADSVAIVEHTQSQGDEVLVFSPSRPGEHVRPAGEDISVGREVFAAGSVLGPGHLGVLASIGWQKVSVLPAPVVGVLSTGDELVEGGGELRPGQIRDSNRVTLLSLLRRDGYPAVDLGIARDEEEQIRQRLAEGAGRCQALITSGGVSMGEFDYVKKVLDEMAHMAWMQVAIRPAKPFAFGVMGGVPVFGLPGNPVSAMVSYELLARPALRRMAGHPDSALFRGAVPAVADDDSLRRRPDGRVNYSRVVAHFGTDGRYHVRSAGGQGSNLLFPMAQANALAVVPDGTGVPAGGEVEVLVLA